MAVVTARHSHPIQLAHEIRELLKFLLNLTSFVFINIIFHLDEQLSTHDETIEFNWQQIQWISVAVEAFISWRFIAK